MDGENRIWKGLVYWSGIEKRGICGERRMREYDREGEGMVNNRMECDSMTKGS